MRVALSTYNPVKECQSCTWRDEKEISAHILAYQVAHQLLKNYEGTMSVDRQAITVRLNSLEEPLTIDLQSGLLSYKSLNIPLAQNYATGKRLSHLFEEITEWLELPEPKSTDDRELYTLVTKLVEIFHARCGLHMVTLESEDSRTTWELRLCHEGPQGWISSDGVAKNRFGEVLKLDEWKHLRPEKLAAYVFGFNRFCSHYPSPIQEKRLN